MVDKEIKQREINFSSITKPRDIQGFVIISNHLFLMQVRKNG